MGSNTAPKTRRPGQTHSLTVSFLVLRVKAALLYDTVIIRTAKYRVLGRHDSDTDQTESEVDGGNTEVAGL